MVSPCESWCCSDWLKVAMQGCSRCLASPASPRATSTDASRSWQAATSTL